VKANLNQLNYANEVSFLMLDDYLLCVY